MLKKNSSKKRIAASVISIVICLSMLLGATYAWWSASNSQLVSKIQSGNLSIELVDSNGNSLLGKTLGFVDEEGQAVEETLWAPGSSYAVEDLYVKNTGTTDIKFKVEVIGISGDDKLADVINWTVGEESTEGFEVSLAADETSDAIVLTGTMDKSAGNQYMNLTADGVAIAVYATQDNDEATYEQVVALIKELEDKPSNLAVAYTFVPTPGAPEDKYADWNADYVISFDQDVAAGKVYLAGQYDAWSEDWLGFNNPTDIAAGQEIRLLKDTNGIYVTYDECCNVIKEFNCGAASDISGLTMTVELRVYEKVNGAETGIYVTAGTYTYTF